jgi:hypothetical protein
MRLIRHGADLYLNLNPVDLLQLVIFLVWFTLWVLNRVILSYL